MLHFPQLLSGATAQYPFVKRRIQRTVRSVAPGGGVLKLHDPGWAMVNWELTLRALTPTERAELEAFFDTVEGRLGEFTFLDPTDNLLLRSEALAAAVWSKGPSLELTEGVADPEAGTSATRIRNTGGDTQSIQQTVNGAGWFHYCLSLSVKSEAAARCTLFRSTAGADHAAQYTTGPQWRRVTLSGRSQSQGENVTFGIRLEPGEEVTVHGLQAEAQVAPSTYRRTTSRSGLYEGARFDDDQLSMTAEGPEQYSCKVRIAAPAAD